ncbi:MAG: MaoC family dehydratase N-terminal domain-containing protein [Dehalococcoidia bacterium]
MSLLSEAEAGRKFGPYEVTLTRDDAARYAAAVGGSESPDYGQTLPPLAVIAAGLSKLITELGLAGGTVHAGQEVEFHRPVTAGETVTAHAELKSNAVRRDSRFATIMTEFKDESGAVIATASSTVIVPA